MSARWLQEPPKLGFSQLILPEGFQNKVEILICTYLGGAVCYCYFNFLWEPSSSIIKRSHQNCFDEFVEHGTKFLILQSVSCLDPSRWLQMAPGAAQKSWKLGKPQLRRLLEPSRRHVIEMFLEIWALTQVNFLNPEGHKCSPLGRACPDGSKIWAFTSASRFLLWLGGITRMLSSIK